MSRNAFSGRFEVDIATGIVACLLAAGGVLIGVGGLILGLIEGGNIATFAVVAAGIVCLFSLGLVAYVAYQRRAAPRASRALLGASRLLPADVRNEYFEEWAAWMADLRADGTPRIRRWLELLSLVLIALPRLAIGLAARRRAVDR
jgi:hypothetical protein